MSIYSMPGRAAPAFLSQGRNPRNLSRASLYGWQLTTTNTGLSGAGVVRASLPTYTGSSTVSSGTTISLKKITSAIDITAGNITIDRCWIQPSSASGSVVNAASPPTSVTVKDCDIDGSLITASTSAYLFGVGGQANVLRCYINDLGSGIAYNWNSVNSNLSVLVEGNYVHANIAFGDPATTGNHADGITIREFGNATGKTLTVLNNRSNCDSANATGAFFIQASGSDDIANVTVRGNLFEGLGNQCILEQKSGGIISNVFLFDNRFSDTGFGSGYVDGGAVWNSQSDNYVDDAAQVGHRGSPVSF